MSTPFTDANSWYGGYVPKAHPMVMASKVRELEENYHEQATRARHAELEIADAHQQLDKLGAPRLQPSGLPFSMIGRLRAMGSNNELSRSSA